MSVRPIARADTGELARLYFAAYDPGVACATLDEAEADIVASFDGAYGELWIEASPCAVADGALVAAAMTVRRAPWHDVPDGPFIIELFTARGWRRRGLAAALLGEIAGRVAAGGARTVSLRVDDANVAALALYSRTGFAEWSGNRS